MNAFEGASGDEHEWYPSFLKYPGDGKRAFTVVQVDVQQRPIDVAVRGQLFSLPRLKAGRQDRPLPNLRHVARHAVARRSRLRFRQSRGAEEVRRSRSQ